MMEEQNQLRWISYFGRLKKIYCVCAYVFLCGRLSFGSVTNPLLHVLGSTSQCIQSLP